MQVITLAQVKTQLGINDASYDSQITAKLPIIDAKVKMICNNNFNYRFAGEFTSGESTLIASPVYYAKDSYQSGIMNKTVKRDISGSLIVGAQLEGDGIADDTYITNIYKSGTIESGSAIYDVLYVELSEATESDQDSAVITAGISVGYLDVLANGVMYLINGTSTTLSDNSWTSRSIGGASVSRSQDDVRLEALYGMPSWFIKALPRYM